jgi:hypothetical protein
MAMNRDPDFLSRRGIYEQFVGPLDGTLLHESGRFELSNHFGCRASAFIVQALGDALWPAEAGLKPRLSAGLKTGFQDPALRI